METTISTVLKHGGPSTVVLIALLFVWADFNGALNELRAEMAKGDQAIRAEMNGAGGNPVGQYRRQALHGHRARTHVGEQKRNQG